METINTVPEDAAHRHVIATRYVCWSDLASALAGASQVPFRSAPHADRVEESRKLLLCVYRLYVATSAQIARLWRWLCSTYHVVHLPAFIYSDSRCLRYTAQSLARSLAADALVQKASVYRMSFLE